MRFVSVSLAEHDFADLTGERPGSHSHHEEPFYSEDASFPDDLTQFVGAALKNGEAVVVIARQTNQVNILQRLRSDGVDVGTAAEEKRYIPVDIAESLSTFSVPHVIEAAVRTAKEKYLHVAVG